MRGASVFRGHQLMFTVSLLDRLGGRLQQPVHLRDIDTRQPDVRLDGVLDVALLDLDFVSMFAGYFLLPSS